MVLTSKDIARFWSKVDVCGEDECWPWLGYTQENVVRCRPCFSIGTRETQKKIIVARVVWLITEGELPELSVLHSCDNPICCNRKHLFLGTHDDNMKDMVAKGRASRNKAARKLSDEAVLEIRGSKKPLSFFSKKFGVVKSTVSEARNRQTFPELL